MAFDPSLVQVLLVGPRVAHLAPFFERRGYQTVAETDGTAASESLQLGAPDLILLELSLGPMNPLDFIALARGIVPDARMLLLEDVSRAGHIVKALLAGVHGYVPTPPDEMRLFEQVEAVVDLSPRFRRSDADIQQIEARAKTLEQNLASAVKRAETAEQASKKGMSDSRALEDKLEAARTEVTEKTGAIAKLRAELEKAPKAAAIASLEKKIKELEAVRDEKAAVEKALKKRDEEIVDAQKRLSVMAERQAETAIAMAAADDEKKRLAALEIRAERIPELERIAASVDETKKGAAAAESRAAAAEESRLAMEAEVAKVRHDRDAVAERAEAAVKAAEQREKDADKRGKEADARARAAEEHAAREADRVRKELNDEIAAAHRERERAEERAIDREIEFEDLNTLIAELQSSLVDEQKKVADLEARLRQEKLRFVEQQELRGSDDAYRKMESMVDELTRLRRERDAYVAKYGPLS